MLVHYASSQPNELHGDLRPPPTTCVVQLQELVPSVRLTIGTKTME